MNVPDFHRSLKVWRKLWGACLVATVLSPVWAEDLAPSKTARPADDARMIGLEMQERRSAMEGFRQKLEAAKTPEEKRAVMEQWRDQSRRRIEQRRAEAPPQSNPAETVARMKAAAAGNPELLARAEQMEKRLVEVEKTKAKLERIRQTEGEEKRKLMEELREERTEQARLRKLEMQVLQKERGQTETQRDAAARSLPPEMQARLAEHEERRKAIERVQEALKSGNAEERDQAREALRQLQAESREKLRRRMEEQNPASEQGNPVTES